MFPLIFQLAQTQQGSNVFLQTSMKTQSKLIALLFKKHAHSHSLQRSFAISHNDKNGHKIYKPLSRLYFVNFISI